MSEDLGDHGKSVKDKNETKNQGLHYTINKNLYYSDRSKYRTRIMEWHEWRLVLGDQARAYQGKKQLSELP